MLVEESELERKLERFRTFSTPIISSLEFLKPDIEAHNKSLLERHEKNVDALFVLCDESRLDPTIWEIKEERISSLVAQLWSDSLKIRRIFVRFGLDQELIKIVISSLKDMGTLLTL